MAKVAANFQLTLGLSVVQIKGRRQASISKSGDWPTLKVWSYLNIKFPLSPSSFFPPKIRLSDDGQADVD